MAEKILVVDDDIDTLKLVGLMLERQGYEISVASNGHLGLTKATTDKPDLILLDVMMPDIDGYEVTRRLRSDPGLAHIPIIMFTAKSMVDDKVAGFEAGVDDYLTKPTHPAELTAHVKAVLARSAQARAAPSEKATTLAVIGAKGGLGTSTIAVNIGISLTTRGQDVILAELNPGRGSLGLDLGIANPTGLSHLLSRSLKDIHLRSVEGELVSHRSGLRLLLASHSPKEAVLEQAIPQMEALISSLAVMCTTLLLELGSGPRPYLKPIAQVCDRILIIVEPVHPAHVIARGLIEDMVAGGVPRQKMSMALITRERTSLQIPWRQIEAELGISLAGIISPAPEQAHQASQAATPLVMLHPDSLAAEQLHKLAANAVGVPIPAEG
jgi:DNA-binding response OmpR family regulator